jgi:hypothetical protein
VIDWRKNDRMRVVWGYVRTFGWRQPIANIAFWTGLSEEEAAQGLRELKMLHGLACECLACAPVDYEHKEES